jgi:O-antigen ligase
MLYSYFGVGLGNFYNFLSNSYKKKSINPWVNDLQQITFNDPHNILLSIGAENGFLALLFFTLLLLFFLKKDMKNFFGKKIINKILILSFWNLFLLGLQEPTYTLGYQILFWVLRGLLF